MTSVGSDVMLPSPSYPQGRALTQVFPMRLESFFFFFEGMVVRLNVNFHVIKPTQALLQLYICLLLATWPSHFQDIPSPQGKSSIFTPSP